MVLGGGMTMIMLIGFVEWANNPMPVKGVLHAHIDNDKTEAYTFHLPNHESDSNLCIHLFERPRRFKLGNATGWYGWGDCCWFGEASPPPLALPYIRWGIAALMVLVILGNHINRHSYDPPPPPPPPPEQKEENDHQYPTTVPEDMFAE